MNVTKRLKRLYERHKPNMTFDEYEKQYLKLFAFLVNNNALYQFVCNAAAWNRSCKWRVISKHPFKRSSYRITQINKCEAFMSNRGITEKNAVMVIAMYKGDAIQYAFQWIDTKEDWCYWSELSNKWECEK